MIIFTTIYNINREKEKKNIIIDIRGKIDIKNNIVQIVVFYCYICITLCLNNNSISVEG